MDGHKAVLIINGVPGAGKTTVSHLIVGKLPLTALINARLDP
jgi:adenylate kinase family enzyme